MANEHIKATLIGPTNSFKVSPNNAVEVLMMYHKMNLQKDIIKDKKNHMTFVFGDTVEVSFLKGSDLKKYQKAWESLVKAGMQLSENEGYIGFGKVASARRKLSKWMDSFVVNFNIDIKKKGKTASNANTKNQTISFRLKGSNETFAFKSWEQAQMYTDALKAMMKEYKIY